MIWLFIINDKWKFSMLYTAVTADGTETTEAPGGLYSAVCFHSTMKTVMQSTVLWTLCHNVPFSYTPSFLPCKAMWYILRSCLSLCVCPLHAGIASKQLHGFSCIRHTGSTWSISPLYSAFGEMANMAWCYLHRLMIVSCWSHMPPAV